MLLSNRMGEEASKACSPILASFWPHFGWRNQLPSDFAAPAPLGSRGELRQERLN